MLVYKLNSQFITLYYYEILRVSLLTFYELKVLFSNFKVLFYISDYSKGIYIDTELFFMGGLLSILVNKDVFNF